MIRCWSVLFGLLGLVTPGRCFGETPQEALFYDHIEPILIDACFDCHGDGADRGDFALDDYDSIGAHLKDIPNWYEIWKNIRHNLMPPADERQLSDAEKGKVLKFIVDEVFKIDREHPDPGRVTMRRLNRVEYYYTIKDLLKVEFDTANFFPPDDTGYGFDTIGSVLNLSPLLMDKYLAAAGDIAAQAVPIHGPQILEYRMDVNGFSNVKSKQDWLGNIPLDTKLKLEGQHKIFFDGEYEIEVYYRMGGSREATEETGVLSFGSGDEVWMSQKVAWDNSQSLVAKTKRRMKKGGHIFFVAMQPDQARDEGEARLHAEVHKISVRGPLDGSQKDYPSQFRYIFSDGPPPAEIDRDPYRAKILGRLASQLFRRPVGDDMIARLVTLSRNKDKQPKVGFEESIRYALKAILVNPRFLLRSELQPDPDNPKRIQLLDEYSLASRLSYFLWLSAPDAKLFELAKNNQLREQLIPQVERMLKSYKSLRFIDSFVGQWLQTSELFTTHIDASQVLPKDQAKRLFNSKLRKAMGLESDRLFQHVLNEQRPAVELLTADYTFLNDQLADWYQIDGVEGHWMRKVELSGPAAKRRGGLLKHAAFQVVTSNPTRTSPVNRGLFVLENLLAIPPPAAAPDVPPLKDSIKAGGRTLSLREAMALHSEQKLCASCHARMDPIGLALENYNMLGMWVDEYDGQPIDTAGKLISGETFSNADELSRVLATEKRTEFLTALTEKLFTFGIGRGVEYYDGPTIDAIVSDAEANGGKLIDILYGVIQSPAFQNRRGDGSDLVR